MSKGSFATGTMTGKLGIYVFMRRKGEQIQRSYVKPKDAKTRAQGVQRSSLSNIIRLYQSSPSFFKSAFENKPSNQSDYNALVKRNLAKSPRVTIPKDMSDAGGGVVAPYLISDGTLQPIIVTGAGIQARTNIAVGSDFVIDETTTIGALSRAILANNTFLIEGDQLSYLSIEQYSYRGYPRLRSRKYEMRIHSTSTDLVREYMPSFAMTVVGGFIGHGEYVYSGAFAWLYSRVSLGKLQVSRQQLIVTSEDLYDAYTSVDAATRAAGSYNNDREIFLDPNSQNIGQAVQPSVLPSVSTVKLGSTTLASGVTPPIVLSPSGQISIGALQILGSNLIEVQTLSISAVGETSSGSPVSVPSMDLPVSQDSDTRVTNTEVIQLGQMQKLKSFAIYAGASTIYQFNAYIEVPDIEDPLG